MIVLGSTQKLTIVLAGAKTTLDAPFICSYIDVPTTPGPVSGTSGLSYGSTNGTTSVDIVAAPAVGYVRQVMSIILNNADTGSITPSIKVDNSGTAQTVFKVSRATLEQLTYEHGAGWQAFSAAGVRQ